MIKIESNGKKVKLNGKEVKNFALKFLLVFIAGLFAVIGCLITVFLAIASVFLAIALILLLAITFPIWLIIHLVLRISGRQGFIAKGEMGGFSVKITGKGFKKRKSIRRKE